MKKYQRIIVALDLSEFDKKLIRYFDKFCDVNHPQKVHFVYVDKDLETPPGIDLKFRDESGNDLSKDEWLKKKLTAEVEAGFGSHHGATVTIDVLEGPPMKEILHWVNVKDADLLVLGNKKQSEGSGIVAKRIARHAKCAVLFVPETSNEGIHKILVPVDFSDHSKAAMSGALEMAKELKEVSLTCYHTFDVPLTGSQSINMSYERFVRDMSTFKSNALKNYVASFPLNGTEVDMKVVVNENGNPGRMIHQFAVKNQFDLIVIGAKGHHAFERVLLGSVTEKLLALDNKIPVLVLRK